jgi:hypothetical protein
MNSLGRCAAALVVVAAAIWGPAALADTAEATCEVTAHGDSKHGQSGPCTFSQRQGYISINLRNGDRWELNPAGGPDQYRDQKGNKVVRTVSGSRDEFKWEHRRIVVTFGGGGQQYAGGHDREDNFETVCGVMVDGQDHAYRCSVTDVYSGGSKVRTTLRFPDQTLQLNWESGNRVGLQFEGMTQQQAHYSTSEGETNFRFENKTYYSYSNKDRARDEVRNFRN